MPSLFLRVLSALLPLAWALVGVQPPAGAARKLVFDKDGHFKIAQFADLHYGEAEDTLWGPQQDVNSTRVMERVIDWETPNMVVYSGGENIASNSTAYWGKLLQPCIASSTPWASVFGNHDDRSASNGTREDLLKFDTSFSLSLSQFGPSYIHGLTNYYLLLYDDYQSEKPTWVIYFLDSGGGTYPELVYPDQLQWFINTSFSLSQMYGSLPAVAFFHIPSTGYEGLYKRSLCFGMDDDEVSPQIEPNELLVKMVTRGVRGVFVGHNHGNDWCCPGPPGIINPPSSPGSTCLVCYGRHTGYGGYGSWHRGSRIIILKRDSSSVETYVRMENGSKIDGN